MVNIELIKQQVDEIKIDLDALKEDANEFKSQQENFSHETKRQKEIILQQKKESIEIKKKEIERMLIDLKLEQLDQMQLQKVLESEEELRKIGMELELLKQRNRFKRQIDSFRDETEENHALKNTARIVWWVGVIALGIWWIKKLFGRGKKKEKTEDVEKKEKKSRWKRALLWWWWILWWVLVWKNRDTIKDRFSGLFGWEEPKEWDGETENLEDSWKEFAEKLTDAEKLVYNNFADQVNDFYESWAGVFPDELQRDKLGSSSFEVYENEKIPWIVPFMLNNRYTRHGWIDALLSESAFYEEAGLTSDDDGMIQKIKNRTADQIGGFLAPIAWRIDGMMPVFINFKTSGSVDDLVNWIAWSPEARAAIRLAFRKSIMVISYLNSKEKGLKNSIAKEILSQEDPSFAQKSSEDQNDIIEDKINDEDFCRENIDPVIEEFRSKSLYEWIKFLKEKNCLDATIDSDTQEVIDAIEERKKELLDQDDEGNNWIEDIKSEFESGKLSDEGKEDLDELLENFEKDIDNVGSKSWYNKYIPLMNFFDPSDQIMEKIMNSWDYDANVKVFRDKIVAIREKSENWTLVESDLDELKNTIDEYYAFQTSLAMSQTNIEEVVDENGNKILRRWNTIVISWESLYHGGELFVEKKYIEWWLIVAWAVVSLDITTYPIRLAVWLFRWRIAKSPSLRFGYTVWKFILKQGAKLTGRSLNIAMRNHTPARISAKMYKGKDYIFRYELAKGNLSLDKAVKIAKTNGIRTRVGGNIISSEDELIQRVAGIWNSTDDVKKCNLIKKYWNNKNILKQVITTEYTGKWYTMVGRAEKYNYHIRPDVLDELWKVDDFLWRCPHPGKSSLINGFLKTTKSLKPEILQELFATQTFDGVSVEMSKTIGKLLGKKMNKFASLDDFKAFQWFFARNYQKYPTKTFVSNALSKRSKLRKFDEAAQAKYIETAGLNVSRFEKVAGKIKTGVNNMIKDLNGMLKNPKMKTFYNGIKSKITSLTEYNKTVTPESVKAINEAWWLDKMTWFGKLTEEWVQALKSLNALIKTDKALLELLSKANKLDDVKDILKKAWIAVEQIDDNVLMKIVQTKNISKIESIINYGAEMKSINILKKILKNPSMKTFGKWLGIVGIALDFAFVGIDFVSDIEEANRIKQFNMARGQNKEDEAYFDVITWWIWATAWALWFFLLVGASNVWNPVGRVCLAWSWIAMGVESLGDLYYGEIDKFKQNYKDFISQSMPEIKQRLLHINSWQTELDSSFQDLWSNVTGNLWTEEKKALAPKTSADAVKALIYLEELQKYPYAMTDLNDSKVRNTPELEALVKQQKDLHEKSVEMRYTYIKKNYIDGKSSIVSKWDIEKNQWIQKLDLILAESRMCQAVENDENYTNKTDVQWYPKYLESELKKSNADWFSQLEGIYTKDRIHFFEIVASLPYYENILQSIDIADKEKIIANLAFFKRYAEYKLLQLAISDYPTVNINEKTIDYDEITNLLSWWKLTAIWISAAEIWSENIEYLTDNQVREKYNVSNNLWQNVLYEIANKKLGYTGKNDLNELKWFYTEEKKEINGIYFDPGDQDWAINENSWSDNEFATDTELNDKDTMIKMRWYIDDAASSWTTWNMVAENDFANKEYAKDFINIINQNLDYQINPTKYQKEILKYIQTNSNGKYIELPPDLLIIWIKSWIPHLGAFVYAWDGKTLDAKSWIPGAKSWISK